MSIGGERRRPFQNAYFFDNAPLGSVCAATKQRSAVKVASDNRKLDCNYANDLAARGLFDFLPDWCVPSWVGHEVGRMEAVHLFPAVCCQGSSNEIKHCNMQSAARILLSNDKGNINITPPYSASSQRSTSATHFLPEAPTFDRRDSSAPNFLFSFLSDTSSSSQLIPQSMKYIGKC